MIIEDEKLLCVSWEPRETDGIIQPESKGLRTKGTNSVHPILNLKAQEPWMSHPKQREQNFPFFSSLFYLGS